MDKLSETKVINGQNVRRPITVPKGFDPDEVIRRSQAKALGRVDISPLGTATVNCPYCALYYRTANPVDVTAFIDGDGKKEHKAECNKGHVLKFKSIPQWREERQAMGLQVKS